MNAEQVMGWMEDVKDPEVPVLSIVDLGIVRGVAIDDNAKVTVTITPTYSGCPAMDVISISIRLALAGHGVRSFEVKQQLSPAWTTDWMTESGKQKLKEWGIAPPVRTSAHAHALFEEEQAPCPRCGSHNTELVSRFGATSCKALYKCLSCLEPFEYFKCH